MARYIAYPLLALLAFIAGVEYFIGWKAVWEAWQRVNPAVALWAFSLLMISYLCRAKRLHRYFHATMSGRFRCVLRLTLVHNFLNHLIPFRGGEASFPILLKHEFDIPLVTGTSALMWFRLLDLLTMLMIGGLLLMTNRYPNAVFLWFLMLLLPFPWGLLLLRSRILLWVDRHSHHRIRALFRQVLEGLPCSARMIAIDFGWTMLNWLCKIVALAFLLAGLADVSVHIAAVAAISGELASLLPVQPPAGFGIYEGGVIAGLHAGGVMPIDALQPAVNVHIALLVSAFISGVPALVAMQKKQNAENIANTDLSSGPL